MRDWLLEWAVQIAAILAGVGFTVSLPTSELHFGVGNLGDQHVKVAVLTGSVLAALFAAVILRLRNCTHRNTCSDEEVNDGRDGRDARADSSGRTWTVLAEAIAPAGP